MQLPYVRPGDIIEPEHHNAFVRLWYRVAARLDELRTLIKKNDEVLLKQYDETLSKLKSVIERMPTVKPGDDIRRDHFNMKLSALEHLIAILSLLVERALSSPSDLVEQLQAVRRAKEMLTFQWAGDPILAEDHNALVDATLAAVNLLQKVDERLR